MNFRLLNIPVHIHPTFWLFLLFFTNALQHPTIESLILGGVMLFSLLVHEFGHALTALYFGARPQIILEAFGGRAQYNGFGMTPMQHFFITLNGPLLESVLILLSYTLLKTHAFDHLPYMHYLLTVTMRLNILWCLLNLIPILPLDGGQLVRYLLERKFGHKGIRASLIIGLAAAGLFTPYLFIQGHLFFGTLLLFMALQNYQLLKQDETNPYNNYLAGLQALQNNDLTQAKAILTKLLKSKDPKVKNLSRESIAQIYHQENDPQKSYQLLLSVDPQYLTAKPLLCNLAYTNQNYQLVTTYAHDHYTLTPTLETALLNSKAFAHLNDPDSSAGWLHTATLFGPEFQEQVSAALQDSAYDRVRDAEAFREYAVKV